MAVSLELSSLFPTLLQLSTKGMGFGSSFPRGRTRAVSCQKLQLLGCGGGWTGLGAAARALLEDPTGLRTMWQPGLPGHGAGAALSPKAPVGMARSPREGGRAGPWGSGSGMKRDPVSHELGCPSGPTGLSRAGWKCLCCKSTLYLELVSFGRTSVPSQGILLCHQAGRSCPGRWGAIAFWGLDGHSPGPEPFPPPHFCSSPAPGAE